MYCACVRVRVHVCVCVIMCNLFMCTCTCSVIYIYIYQMCMYALEVRVFSCNTHLLQRGRIAGGAPVRRAALDGVRVGFSVGISVGVSISVSVGVSIGIRVCFSISVSIRVSVSVGVSVRVSVSAGTWMASSALNEVKDPIGRPNIFSPSKIWNEPAPQSQDTMGDEGAAPCVCISA